MMLKLVPQMQLKNLKVKLLSMMLKGPPIKEATMEEVEEGEAEVAVGVQVKGLRELLAKANTLIMVMVPQAVTRTLEAHRALHSRSLSPFLLQMISQPLMRLTQPTSQKQQEATFQEKWQVYGTIWGPIWRMNDCGS